MFRATLIAVALTAGGGAAWLALAMAPADVPTAEVSAPQPQRIAMVEVLVAAADIPQGEKVGPEHLGWREWPEGAVHAGLISRTAQPQAASELQGWVSRNGFVAGEPIVADKLAPADSGFLSAMLEPGKLAVAVRVSAENTAGGFILPNDHVDLLHTTSCGAEEGCRSESTTRAILRNVKVLAIDQQGGEDSPEAVVVGKTATLELTPAQAELVVASEATGMLSLALRSAADNGAAQEVAQVVEPPEAAPPAEPVIRTVRVRRAGVPALVVIP